MPVLIVDGNKYRLGNIDGSDFVWNVLVNEKTVTLEILRQPSAQQPALFVRAGGRVIGISIDEQTDHNVYSVEVNGKPLTVTLEEDSQLATTTDSETIEGPVLVSSPMAGKIASVKTPVGATVEEGQSLMVLEAMKMENEIASPKSGDVKELYVKKGDLVKTGDKLCLII